MPVYIFVRLQPEHSAQETHIFDCVNQSPYSEVIKAGFEYSCSEGYVWRKRLNIQHTDNQKLHLSDCTSIHF